MPDSVTFDDICDFFGQLGQIKKSKKNYNMGEPTVHIYKDKRTGRPKTKLLHTTFRGERMGKESKSRAAAYFESRRS